MAMLLTTDGRTHVQMAESAAELAEYVRVTPRKWNCEDINGPRALWMSHSWDMGVDFKQAARLASEGWREGLAKVVEGVRAVPAPTTRHAKLSYDVAGHFPDVARYVSDMPDHMVRRGNRHGAKPVLSVVVSQFLSSAVQAQSAMNFGIAMCDVIDKLEGAGRRIELSVCFYAKHGRAANTFFASGWRIKRASEPLDLASVAYSLAHSTACRRLGFGAWERLDTVTDPSHGFPAGAMSPAQLTLIGCEDALQIDAGGMALCECRDIAAARKFIARALNEAAGETIVEVEQ